MKLNYLFFYKVFLLFNISPLYFAVKKENIEVVQFLATCTNNNIDHGHILLKFISYVILKKNIFILF